MHSLADESESAGRITFIHTDGKEHTFYSCVNKMSGNRLSAFDNNPPDINDSLAWVKSVFRDIRAKRQVMSCIGDF